MSATGSRAACASGSRRPRDYRPLTKLVVREPETAALIEALRDQSVLAADLVRTELLRAVMRAAPDRIATAEDLLGRLLLVRLDEEILDAAGRLGPPSLRTLDAIHIQCALLVGDELDAFVTYDHRQVDAARAAGLRVQQPR